MPTQEADRPLNVIEFAEQILGVQPGQRVDTRKVTQRYWDWRIKLADEKRGGKLPDLSGPKKIIEDGERRIVKAKSIEDPKKQVREMIAIQRDVFSALTQHKGTLELLGLKKGDPFAYMDRADGEPEFDNIRVLGELFPRYQENIVGAVREFVGPLAQVAGTDAKGIIARGDLPAPQVREQFEPSQFSGDPDIQGALRERGPFATPPRQQSTGGNGLALPPANGANGASLPSAQPATATAQQSQEGQTATHPQTGQKLVFRNGKWVEVR